MPVICFQSHSKHIFYTQADILKNTMTPLALNTKLNKGLAVMCRLLKQRSKFYCSSLRCSALSRSALMLPREKPWFGKALRLNFGSETSKSQAVTKVCSCLITWSLSEGTNHKPGFEHNAKTNHGSEGAFWLQFAPTTCMYSHSC